MYKGIGWRNTTGGIINADQTKLGGVKKKVYGMAKGIHICRLAEEERGRGGVEILKMCTRMSSIPSFVGEKKRRQAEGGRVMVCQVR